MDSKPADERNPWRFRTGEKVLIAFRKDGKHCLTCWGAAEKEEGEGKGEAEVVQTWYQNIQCGETSFPLPFT